METSDNIEGRTGTQLVVNSANIIDYADAQIDISVYNPVEIEFGLSPTELGAITAVRGILQAVFTPVWGILSDKYSRKKLLAFGCFLWGIITFVVGLSQSYNQMLISRGINGIALAVITPVSYSLIADYFKPEDRGKAFGFLGLTTVLGAVFGTLYATTIAGGPSIMGYDGWRFAYFSFGAVSILLGFLVLIFAKDPIRGGTEVGFEGRGISDDYSISRKHIKTIFSSKSFIVIVAQGMVGLLPWSALGFMILWFQYIGFSDANSAIMYGIIAIGAAFGNLFGGIMGDRVAKKYPEKGRITLAAISIFSGIPLSLIIFQMIPRSTESYWLIIIIGMVTGFSISWVAPGSNNPILGEIIEPEARSTMYSMQRLFEGSFGAAGTIIVGYLAENYFGYVQRSEAISSISDSMRMTNVNALSNAILTVLITGWTFCFLIYLLLYKTYPQDRARVQKVMQERLNKN